jgi:hypothetical protein
MCTNWKIIPKFTLVDLTGNVRYHPGVLGDCCYACSFQAERRRRWTGGSSKSNRHRVERSVALGSSLRAPCRALVRPAVLVCRLLLVCRHECVIRRSISVGKSICDWDHTSVVRYRRTTPDRRHTHHQAINRPHTLLRCPRSRHLSPPPRHTLRHLANGSIPLRHGHPTVPTALETATSTHRASCGMNHRTLWGRCRRLRCTPVSSSPHRRACSNG